MMQDTKKRDNKVKINNILDYLDWRGDLPFESAGINEVDLLILSELVALEYGTAARGDGFTVAEISERFFAGRDGTEPWVGLLQPPQLPDLLKKAAASRRFGSLTMVNYVNKVNKETTEQFGAVTFILPDGSRCAAFRGTDDTLTGWKENMLLAVKERVQAQEDSVEYLVHAVGQSDASKPFRICGFSKGGNLTAYAFMNAPENVQDRVTVCYNFDGPGFRRELLESEGANRASGRIITVRPQNSVVGVLFHPPGHRETVRCGVYGALSHNPFTWAVLGTAMVREKGLSSSSRRFEKAINGTLESMSTVERCRLVDDFFEALESTGAKTLREISKSGVAELARTTKKLTGDKTLQRFAVTLTEQFIKPSGDLKLPLRKQPAKEQDSEQEKNR